MSVNTGTPGDKVIMSFMTSHFFIVVGFKVQSALLVPPLTFSITAMGCLIWSFPLGMKELGLQG